MHSINFTLTKKIFCLSYHYNGPNNYLFINGAEIYKFKAKDSEILAGPLRLVNVSNEWSVDNMKRTGFTGYVDDFSVVYNDIEVNNIKDIHKYLTKKNDMV